MKIFFYLVCFSAPAVYAHSQTVDKHADQETLRKELDAIKKQQKELIKEGKELSECLEISKTNEKLLEENAELTVNNEDLSEQIKILQHKIETAKRHPAHPSSVSSSVKVDEPVISSPVEEKSRSGIVERAKEKVKHFINSAKHIFTSS